MKKQFFLATIICLISISAANAQGGQRRSPEERVKEAMEKIADFRLDKDKSAKADSVFTSFYKAQQKRMEEMRAAGGTPDREAMMEARKKLAEERDAALKQIFSEEQFKKWKDEIEPGMRTQRSNR